MADQWHKWNNVPPPSSAPAPPSAPAHANKPSSSRLPPLTRSRPLPLKPVVRPPPSSANVKAEDYQPNEVRQGIPPFKVAGGARLPVPKSNAAAPPSVIPTKPKTKVKPTVTPMSRKPDKPTSLPARPPSAPSSMSSSSRTPSAASASATSSNFTSSDASLVSPKPPTRAEFKSIDYWMSLSHRDLILLGIDRYSTAMNIFKGPNRSMLRSKRREASTLHPQLLAHQTEIEDRRRKQSKAAKQLHKEAVEQAESSRRKQRRIMELQRQVHRDAESQRWQAPKDVSTGQNNRPEIANGSTQDHHNGHPCPPSMEPTTAPTPPAVSLKRKSPTRELDTPQHSRPGSPPTKRSRHTAQSLPSPIPNQTEEVQSIAIKEEHPSAETPSELQPTSSHLQSHSEHTKESQRYTQSWLIPAGATTSAPKSKSSGSKKKKNPEYRALPSEYYSPQQSAPSTAIEDTAHQAGAGTPPAAETDYHSHLQSKTSSVTQDFTRQSDADPPPITETAASNPFHDDVRPQRSSSQAQDTAPFSADSLAAASRSTPPSHAAQNESEGVSGEQIMSAKGSIQEVSSAADARQTPTPSKQLCLGSGAQHLPLMVPQVSWKWLSGITIGRDTNKTSAILSVATRSGHTCLRTLSRGHATGEITPTTTQRLDISASTSIEDVRRISSHCVAVAATSSQQIGKGSAQVSLAFARRERDDDDADADDEVHDDLHDDDDDDDDIPLAVARNKAWRPAELHTVPLDPRPHLAGATAVCPFLPVQDRALSFATGGKDGVVCAWNYSRGQATSNRLHALLHRDPITSIETLPKMNLIVSGSRCHSGRGTDVVAFDGRESQIVCSWRSSDILANLSKTSHPRLLDMSLLRADYDQHKLFDLRQDCANSSRHSTKPVMSFGWQSLSAPSHLGRPVFQKSYAIQGCPDGKLRMWDLRQPSDVLQEVKVGNGDEPLGDVVLDHDSAGGGGGGGGASSEQKAVIALTRSAAWRVPLI